MQHTIKQSLFGFCVCTFLLLCSKSTIGQPASAMALLKNGTPQQRARYQDDLMKSHLTLNDVQFTQLEAINLKYAYKLEPILKKDESNFFKYFKARPILEDKEKELKVILSKNQFEKMEALIKEMLEKTKSTQSW